MSRILRAVGLFLLVALWFTPEQIASSDDSSDVKVGSQYLATCLQNAHTLNFLIVLDKSGSLTGTDPDGLRYDALKVALSAMSRLGGEDEESLAVQAAISAFDNTYVDSSDVARWTRLNDPDADTDKIIDRVITDAKRGADPYQGGATNYQAALAGALGELESLAGPGTCNVALWFTDGQFDVGGGEVALRDEMCQQGGLLDEIRSSGIVLIGLQLGTDSTDLRPMSIGDADSTTCGTIPRPEDYAPGIYLRADEPGSLQRVISGLGVILDGCTDAGASGLIDPGIRRMTVYIPTTDRASTIRLRTPAGVNLDVSADGGSSVGGYTTSGTSDVGYTILRVSFPAGEGTGQWAVSADQPIETDELSFCVSAGLTLQPGDNTLVDAAPGATLAAQVVDRRGDPANLIDYTSAVASSTVLGPDGEPRISSASVDDAGAMTIQFDAEPTDARVDVQASVQLTTESGLVLTPIELKFGQQLMLSEDYPSVTPVDQLDLGAAVKRKPASQTLELRGADRGPTQVCLGTVADLRVPADALGTTLDYETGCIDLAAGEVRTVEVSVTPIAAAVGTGQAGIPIQLHPIEASSAVGISEFDLPVVWRFEDPFNPWVLAIVTLVIAAVSVLLPLLALGAANWFAARYHTSRARYASVPVRIRGSELVPALGRERLLSVTELKPLQTSSPRPRRFTLDGLEFRSAPTWDPSRPPRFWVEAPPGAALVTLGAPPVSAADRGIAVRPGLGLFIAVHASTAELSSGDGEATGRLNVISNDPALTTQELSRHLGLLDMSSLRDLARETNSFTSDPAGNGTPSNDDIWND